jgi:hypothetical protein
MAKHAFDPLRLALRDLTFGGQHQAPPDPHAFGALGEKGRRTVETTNRTTRRWK